MAGKGMLISVIEGVMTMGRGSGYGKAVSSVCGRGKYVV